jgi:hypothetical protein
MLKWITDNSQWLFDGIGAGLVVALLGWIASRLFRRREPAAQRQRGGANSVNMQAGRDAHIGDIRRNDRQRDAK